MSMKLYAQDNSELMDVTKIYREKNQLIVEGTMMHSMPIVVRVKPVEIRKAIKLLTLKDLLFTASMLFRTSR